MKIQMLMGLPASGKSTYARELVETNGNWVRINFDDLRSMMNNGVWSRGREKMVQKVAYDIAEETLKQGKNVVWDNTSFAPKHRSRLEQLAKQYGCQFEVQYFHVEPEEAIKRDLARPNSVGAQVIWDMYYRYVWDKPDEVGHEGLPSAVIFDLDGTLAHNDGHRGWYDWEKVGEDKVNKDIAELSQFYRDAGYTIIVVSGRDGSCAEISAKWLVDNFIHFDEIYIRTTGDSREDSVVKKEIFFNNIAERYRVKLVVDDREQVVRMWSDELGLRVLQVRTPGNHPDF